MAPAEHPHSNRGEASAQPPKGSKWRHESPRPNRLALLELTGWAYFSLDSSGRFIEVSHQLAQLLSTTSDALVGVPLVSLCVPPYDILLSEHLLPIDTSQDHKVRADRLRLFLSLRAPSSGDDLDGTPTEDPRPTHAPTETSTKPEQSAVPVELVAIFPKSEMSSDVPDTEVAIEGLLRPVHLETATASAGKERPTELEPRHLGKQLRAITKIGQRVATSEDLDTLLTHLVKSLHHDLHYRYADVYLLSGDRTEATLRASSILAENGDAGLLSAPATDIQFHIDEQSAIGRVVTSGESILINDATHYPNDPLFIHRPDVKSALSVPLTVSEGVVGVLIVQSDAPDTFALEDVVFLQILADHIAIAIENTSLLNERDQHLAELAALNQIGMLLASPGELVDTLNTIIRHVNALFQVEAASLVLVEDSRLHFKVAAGTHIDDIKPYALEIGQGIAGWAVQHNQTVRVNNVAADPRHYSRIDETIGFDTRSLIAVPLRIAERSKGVDQPNGEERVLGVIEIINRIDGRPFNRNDEVLLEFIASSAAVVIENVRLFNELEYRLAEMSALLDTSRAITTLELQAILDTTAERVSTALDAEQAVVYLLDNDRQRLVPRATSHKLQEEDLRQLVFTLGQGTVGRIAETRQSLNIEDAQNDPRFLSMPPLYDEVYCTLGVPLIVQNELIGVLEVVNKRRQECFGSADESLLSAFAGQVALAIHNARLYRETQRRADHLAILGRASEAINRALSLDEILKAAIEATAAMLPTNQGVALLLREGQTDNLSVATYQKFERATLEVLSSLKIDQAYNQGSRLISDSLISDSSPGSEEPVPLFGVPLRGREEVIGLILLGAALPSQETDPLLQTLGDMVAIAIEKASLHEETSRRLAEVSTLYTLANQITTVLDLDRILETTVTIINHALDCQGCCLYLHDPQTGDLTLKASSGWGRGEKETADLELINQVSRRVLRERRPVNLTNIKSDRTGETSTAVPYFDIAAFSDRGELDQDCDTSICSLLVVPLITKNDLIGTLSVYDRASEAFGPNEGRLLTIAAAQVSVAIENARLLRNLHDRAIQLEQALEELRELHRLKTEFVQNVSHELRTPLTFIKSYVQLILEGAMGEINADLSGALTIVDQRTDAVIRLVNDVISLEQMEMGKFEFQPVSLAEVAAQSVEAAAMTARKFNINIELQAVDDLPLVQADPGRLGQVFDNLLGNAIKFSPAGKSITVQVLREGNFVRADVEDQGIGIPADKLDQIFDRFYQVDGSTTRRYSGTGLGLAIVKTIVESHGGQVIVESEVGVGSTFSIILPIPPQVGGQ